MSIVGVTPLAGVWIEILAELMYQIELAVTPLAGVWIEISGRVNGMAERYRHSPCGSVD